ncbi:MAG: GNAT family N-acetyltransferase [Thermostichales cyanobacterium BF4_bins_65]
MITIATTTYQQNQGAITQVRMQVFVTEQGVPPELEMDDRDPECVHVLAWDGDKPVATGRLDLAKGGKVGRLAVLKEYRQRGIGRQLMHTLEEIARHHQLDRVWFHAQVAAIPFYGKLGYRVSSEVFQEAGIPHVVMEKSLTAEMLDPKPLQTGGVFGIDDGG